MRKSTFLSTVAVAVMLTASMLFSTPAFATSRTTTTEVTGTGRTAADAAQVLGASRATATGEGVTAGVITDKAAIEGLKNLDNVAALVNTVATSAVSKADISVIDSMELTVAPGVEVSEAKPLFVSFSFPGITKSTRAYVLHYGKNGWEVVPTTVEEGKVIGKFTSFSPVAIVAETSTLNSSVLGANRATSPRTGDNNMFVIVACAGVLLAGSIFAKKKVTA
jgi:hypothetical protein